MKSVTIAVLTVTAAVSNAFYSGGPQNPYVSQQSLGGFNILEFLGGNGPYVDRESLGIDRDPPPGCQVDQVVMAHRHGARYPIVIESKSIQASMEKLKKCDLPEIGSLSFFKDWDYIVENDGLYELETYSGPYAGLVDSFKRGAEYRSRYGHLWDKQSKVAMWASGSQRIVETARKFGEGFFGYNYSDVAALNVVPEDFKLGVNTLSPICENIGVSNKAKGMLFYPENYSPRLAKTAVRLNNEYNNMD